MTADSDDIKPRVLVVCDDKPTTDALLAILDRRFACVCAENVAEAFLALDRESMPPFSAAIVCCRDRVLDFIGAAGKRWPGLGILLISDRDSVKTKSDDKIMVVRKPVDASEVIMWVDHVVTASGMFKLLRGLQRDILPGGPSQPVASD